MKKKRELPKAILELSNPSLKHESRLLEGIILYSKRALTFYRAFNAGLGTDDIRELPTTLNSYLHMNVNMKVLNEQTSAGTIACVGRYADEFESEEKKFEFEGYFTDVVNVDLGLISAETNVASKRLSKCLLLAAEAHNSQKRKSDNSPYLCHLVEVQNLLVNVANVTDEDIIIASVLHDILEDTRISKAHLLQEFGSRVTNIVVALTEDKTIPLNQRRKTAIEKIKTAPPSVKLIKLADICSNAKSIPRSWDFDRTVEYFDWLDILVKEIGNTCPELVSYYLHAKSIQAHN
jgi:guanosine-3',5'-bis(diphosphate) 3'-pyrophosphohydrolase